MQYIEEILRILNSANYIKLATFANHNRAIFIGWLSIVLSSIAQFILAPVIKYHIGIIGLGIWHLLFQTFNYLQLIDVGFSNGIVREIASANAKGNIQKLRDVNATANRGLTVIGFIFTSIGLSACIIIPHFIKMPNEFRNTFIIALILISIWGIFRYRNYLAILRLRGLNKIVEFNLLNLIEGPGRPILGAIFLCFELGLVGIVLGYIIIEALVRFIASKIQMEEKHFGQYRNDYFLKMLTYGGATAIISFSNMLIFYSSSFIVGWKMDVSAVAVYQSTIALPFLVMRFAIIPFSNFLPRFISYFENNHISTLRKKGQYAHYKVLIASTTILIIVCLLNKKFVIFWVGENLFAGYYFTIIYSLFIIFSIARHNGYIMYQASESLKTMLLTHLIEIPMNLILSIFLIIKLGLIGLAIAFAVSHLIPTITSQFTFFHKSLIFRQ